MSDLEEQCHIDKGTYTSGPVLTAEVRALFSRIEELESENKRLQKESNFWEDEARHFIESTNYWYKKYIDLKYEGQIRIGDNNGKKV